MNLQKRNHVIFKIVLIVLLVSFSKSSTATNYYFSSSSGDDARDNSTAQHPKTPWKTIDKLNSIASTLKAGDSIFFKAGEKFYGSIQLKRIGSATQPIVFTIYGKGSRPVITGLTPINSWHLTTNGIYQAKCTSCKMVSANMVVVNSVQQSMGRYPNNGYLLYESHTGNTSITDNDLKDERDWSGAELVIRKNHWVIDRSTLRSRTGAKLNYTGGSSSEPSNGSGYFIQNDLKTLDQLGEWYFDSSTENINVFFGNQLPGSFRINASTKDILIDISECNSIVIENISLEGAAQTAIKIKNSKKIIVNNCVIDLSATDGINASGCPDLQIANSKIDHSLNDAIVCDSSCRAATIRNNIIRNTGLIAGMGKSGTGTYQALSVFGENSLVEFNEIDSSGYNAIYFGGNSTTVKNNLIRNFCSVKDDGAGIYVGDWFPSTGKKIIGNIVLHGIGARDGSKKEELTPVEGIYIDDNTSSVQIESNSVVDCPDAGMKIHNARDIQINDNTCFNNGIQLLIAHDNLHPDKPIRNLNCSNNIFFCRTSNQLCAYIYSVKDDLREIGSIDSNYYYGTVNDQPVVKAVSNIWTSKAVVNNYSLANWQESHNQDRHSRKLLSKKFGEQNISFEYNFSEKNKEIQVNGIYAGVNGATEAGKTILRPYRSVVLAKGVKKKDLED